MLELLRILRDNGDGSYAAVRLLGDTPAGMFSLVISDGPPLLMIGEMYAAHRERIADPDNENDSGELVYVLTAAAVLG